MKVSVRVSVRVSEIRIYGETFLQSGYGSLGRIDDYFVFDRSIPDWLLLYYRKRKTVVVVGGVLLVKLILKHVRFRVNCTRQYSIGSYKNNVKVLRVSVHFLGACRYHIMWWIEYYRATIILANASNVEANEYGICSLHT